MRVPRLVRTGPPRPGPALGRMALLWRAGLAMAVAFLWALPAQAQTGEVSGRVVDEATQQPIEGAQVVVVGTNIRARTRADGLYNLVNVPSGPQQIRAMIIGHATQTASLTIQPGVTTTVDFALGKAVVSLDAMVVTGQAGEISRREVGNSLTTISADRIEALPIDNVGQALQGLAAGITVMDNSGQAGIGQRIRLRGINSVSMGNQPLIYVDGVRVIDRAYNDDPETGNLAPSPLNDFNPEDIERVEVVKRRGRDDAVRDRGLGRRDPDLHAQGLAWSCSLVRVHRPGLQLPGPHRAVQGHQPDRPRDERLQLHGHRGRSRVRHR